MSNIVHLIEARARESPDAPALHVDEMTSTYAELLRRARDVSRAIGAHAPNVSTVGVMADRSLELVVALLATLQRGAAYVPLDPDAPPERTRRLCEKAGVEL